MTELLHVRGVCAGYGASRVLDDIDLRIEEGQSVALLGRNGVGKTTFILTLLGLTRLHAGEIVFLGRSLLPLATDQRARLGLGWVPQERLIFSSLTVRQNLDAVARPGSWTTDKVFALFPRLLERVDNGGTQLSGGEQQMLAIGRALVTNPRLLLLDEPFEGLAPVLVEELLVAIRALTASGGLTLVLVEQHARLAMSLTERAVVLDRGRIVHQGACSELARDPALLGKLLSVA